MRSLWGWRTWIVGAAVPYAGMLASTSANPVRDVLALALSVGTLLSLGRLRRALGDALPFAGRAQAMPLVGSGPRRRLVIACLLVSAVVYAALWWPTLTKDVEQSSRYLLAAAAHSDEGIYKRILERMFAEGTINPHPEQIAFNYGHLHLNLVSLPVLPVRGLLDDPAAVAFAAGRLVNFVALLGLAALCGVWSARRWGPAVGVAAAALIATHPTCIDRATLAQSPDVLLALVTAISVFHLARLAESPSAPDLFGAVFWAGVSFGTKYAGLFVVPLIVLVLLRTWRASLGRWPGRGEFLRVAGLSALTFVAGVVVCSPYHVFYPRAVALVFFRAGSEYFPGSFDPLLGLRGFFGVSLLDMAAAVACGFALLVGGRRLFARPAAALQKGDAVVVVGAWALLWTGYVALLMHNNVGAHILLPAAAFLLLPLARVARAPARLKAPGARAAWSGGVLLAMLVASTIGPGRDDALRSTLERGRRPSALPPVTLEVSEWLEQERIPTHCRILSDLSFYLPERYPTFVHDHGPLFARSVGLFNGFPEVLVVHKGMSQDWQRAVGVHPRLDDKRELYAALAERRAEPYVYRASMTNFEVFTLPWWNARELVDASARISGDLSITTPRVRNPFYVVERRFHAYRGSGKPPRTVEVELPQPGTPRWLVLLWDTRENMIGWYQDEAYATEFRLEAWVDETWTPIEMVSGHTPDRWGGYFAELESAPTSTRFRLVIDGWHGPLPVRIERFSLLE